MAATTSMQQHYGLQTPLRTLNRGNHFLRSSRNAVSVKRKSAVELLQETKSLYVKSETVLDRKQELKSSSSSSCNYSSGSTCTVPSVGRYKENKTGSLDGRDQMPVPPLKSPRLVNLPQRRCINPAPPTCSDQLQNKLRRLLNADSKENLLDDGTPESIELPPPRSISRCSSHTEDRVSINQHHCPVHHKSLPDLHTSLSSSSGTSDQSDPPSYEYTTYNTSSDKSVSKSKSGDAMSLDSSHSRQPSLQSSSENSDYEAFIVSHRIIETNLDSSDCESRSSMDIEPIRNFSGSFDKILDSEDESSFSAEDQRSYGAHSSAFMVVGSPVKSSASYGGSTSETDYRCSDSDWNASEKTEEPYNWRPILRSKSDVGRRYARLTPSAEAQSPVTPPDLETFFEHLGLDSADYNMMIKNENGSCASSPVFFSDTSTVDSANLCAAREPSSDTGRAQSPGDLPSIVERNARIIKWLCNCRKAQMQASGASQSSRHTTLS